MDFLTIRNTLRMEVACFVIIAFIAVIYFSVKREKTKLHITYSTIIIMLETHLIFDAITVYTVNNLDTVPLLFNDICHRIFMITMIFTIFLFYQYVSLTIDAEKNNKPHSKFYLFVRKFMVCYMVIATALIAVTPLHYEITPKGNYVTGIGAAVICISIPLCLIHMIINTLYNYKYISVKKRIAIIILFVIEIIVSIITVLDMSLLIAGMGLTLEAVCFYVILENPDIRLVEQLREEKKKVEAINESKTKFVSTVSHEIRTPMNAIVGMTEVLLGKGKNFSEEELRYLNNIKNSGDSLVKILNDILDISKIEAGKFDIINKPYKPLEMLDDIRMIIENRIGYKPIKLIYDIDKRLSEGLDGDSLRLRQILINLLNNAVKFTDKGEIKLTVNVLEISNSKCRLKFSVKDSGQGIKSEDLRKIFKAFSQVDKEKNHGKEGTGIGLSVSSELITLMGGKLSVESEYGTGTEFHFEIEQDIAEVKPEENNAPDLKSIKGIHVLIVDDTEINLEVAEAICELLEVNADIVMSGKEALEKLAIKKYDIIFTDYIMPNMSGTELTRKIRQLDDVYFKNVPIIALTGDTSKEAKQEFIEAGVNDYLEKPINSQKLNSIAVKWINCRK